MLIDQAGFFSFKASGNELIYALSFTPVWSFATLEWVLRIRIFSYNLFKARAKGNSSMYQAVRDYYKIEIGIRNRNQDHIFLKDNLVRKNVKT